jgi:hypothetical protein
VFRNTVRILLNDYENITIREKIERENENKFIIYSEKLNKIDSLLKELVNNKIRFVGDSNFYKLIDNVSTCAIKDKDKCTNTPNLCALSENEHCDLILPEKNLITNKDNKPIYFGRMSDELVRYSRIKNFMFQPQTYLSFGNVGYNLRDDEIIMIQSLLTQEYFETLTQNITNPYVNYRSYDEADPILTQSYDNIVKSLEPIRNSINENDCLTIKKTKITSHIWSEIFPPSYNEIRYDKHIACTYQIMIDLLKLSTNKISTINQIKKDLFEIYKTLMKTYHQDKIMDILILEGKKSFGDQVKSGSLSFEDFIYGEQYYLTPFDLWLLLQKYQIPSFFISQQFLFQTNYKKHAFLTYGDFNNNDTSFVFIVIPGLKPQQIPGYKYIENDQNEAFISIDFLLNESKGETMIQEAFRNKITIENYLTQFVKPSTTKYIKKKPLIILESDD